MAFRLPPLNALRIFEAAARHKSFRRAAEELNVTASAVSHAMQTLEEAVGVELFRRETRGLRLTPAGSAYLPAVADALAMLSRATGELPGRQPTGKLRISSAPTFAKHVLLPRLPEFIDAHPGISITIDTSRQLVDLPVDGFDIAIRSAPAASAPHWIKLMDEMLVPVCAPAVKARFATDTEAEFFRHVPLIHTMLSADWGSWFAASGVTPPEQLDGLHVDTLQMAFDAAAHGLGIAIGRRPLVDGDLASGRLVAAIDRAVRGPSYWLITSGENFERPEVKAFRRWMSAAPAGAAPRFEPKPAPLANPRRVRSGSRTLTSPC
jgi:DNA-binding transcriptional LysR family regulator